MFACARQNEEVEVVKKRNPVIDNLSMSLLRSWDIFRQMSDEDVLEIKSLNVFHTPANMGCRGGLAVIFSTFADEVFGLGHNCSNINILGFSRDTRGYKKDLLTRPLMVGDLSYKRIKDLSIGGVIGAAIADCGTLFWWGLCCRRNSEVATPHVPSNGRCRYVKVACGHKMMVALIDSMKVYVWGQVLNSSSRYFDGELLRFKAVIKDISCGLHHVAMLDVQGRVFTWGRGNEGQRSLNGYNFNDQTRVKRIDVDPCTKVKCGPYSTLCLTIFRELRACGSNGKLHLGTKDRSRQVKTLSRISVREAFSDLVVLWGPDSDSARMAAATTDGEIFTWGNTPFPSSSDHRSFFDVFTAWGTTPGMTSVSFPSPVFGWTVANIITPRELRSVKVTDVLNYVYLRDRPQQADHHVPYSSRVSTRDISFLPTKITCGESGKSYVMEKYFRDVYRHSQDVPDEPLNGHTVGCLPFKLCPSTYCNCM